MKIVIGVLMVGWAAVILALAIAAPGRDALWITLGSGGMSFGAVMVAGGVHDAVRRGRERNR